MAHDHDELDERLMRLLLSWLRDFVDVTASAEEIAETLALARLRGRVDRAARRRRRRDRLRGHRQPARLPERPRPRARGRDRLRPAAHAAVGTDAGATVRLAAVPPGVIRSRHGHDRRRRAVPALRGGGRRRSRSGRRPPGWPRACRPPASGRSARSSTSPTTCSSSSASRCTRSIWRASPAREIRVRRAKPGETITTLDGVERTLDPDMLVIADRDRAQAVAGVMGGAASEVSAATTHGRVRERVLQAGVGPAHEQAARPEDRGLVALRARRRHQRAGRRAPARDRADGADRRRPAGRADRRRATRSRAQAAARCTCAARGSRACSARRCPTRTSSGSCAASASR